MTVTDGRFNFSSVTVVHQSIRLRPANMQSVQLVDLYSGRDLPLLKAIASYLYLKPQEKSLRLFWILNLSRIWK